MALQDPGGLASDAQDGIVPLVAAISYNGNPAAAVNTGQVTAAGMSYIITYSAQDKCCNAATPVTRTVAIISPCTAPEVLCASGEGDCTRRRPCVVCLPVPSCACEVKGTLESRSLRCVPAILYVSGEGSFLWPGHAALFCGGVRRGWR